eukprot:SAG11_NODE_106_length_16423_cov_51.220840_5_plen_69_part_00
MNIATMSCMGQLFCATEGAWRLGCGRSAEGVGGEHQWYAWDFFCSAEHSGRLSESEEERQREKERPGR